MPAVAIEPYPHPPPPVTCRPFDLRAAGVADVVAAAIRELVPGAAVDHVGSTAVPGCAGKGTVDLLIPYRDPVELRAIDAALAALGFGRQRTRDPFPEDRPMRTGALAYDGATFLLHVHVVPADDAEVARLRAFRDRLRADPALVAAYVARKEAIIAAGTTDGVDYAEAKGPFVAVALARSGEDGVDRG